VSECGANPLQLRAEEQEAVKKKEKEEEEEEDVICMS
jgi:hypothetical protein